MNTSSHKYISICGPLASGKTSLTKVVCDAFNFQPIYEDLSLNPYFADYYQDNKRWGFHVVTSFLVNALNHQENVRNLLKTTSVCQDWFFGEHHGVYGYHVLEQKIIDKRDFDVCTQLNNHLMKTTPKPDLLIFLHAQTSTILSRIAKRQRAGEAGQISKEYVMNLLVLYQNWINTLNIPVLKINTDKYNFIDTQDHRGETLDLIKQQLDF